MTHLEGEELLKSILDSTHHGIVALKAVRNSSGAIQDFSILLINAEGERILGRNAHQLIGQRMVEIFPKSSSVELLEALQHVVENGVRFKDHMAFELNNEKHWFSLQATPFADGVTLSFTDITEEKLQSIHLRDSESKYRKLFEESMDSIFLMNSEYLILEANQAMVNLFGHSQKELRFLSFSDLFVDEEAFWHFNKTLYKQNFVEEFEAELRLANGKTAVCLINLIQIIDQSNDVAQYQGVLKDISKRKKAEYELLLAEKLSMTGKIARSIAHEVRNPLTNLNLALEQLKDEVPENVEDAELYFNIISRNARRIEELIASLLESAKPKSLILEKRSINEVIKAAIAIVDDRLKLQQMKLNVQLDEDIPELPIDTEQMKVAFVNLMINAIEAMRSGEGELTIKTNFIADQVHIYLRDNGKGIPPENIKRLFDPFFTAKKGGMGLGLTSVQNIIQSHLGEIEVESRLNEVTQFHISFSI